LISDSSFFSFVPAHSLQAPSWGTNHDDSSKERGGCCARIHVCPILNMLFPRAIFFFAHRPYREMAALNFSPAAKLKFSTADVIQWDLKSAEQHVEQIIK